VDKREGAYLLGDKPENLGLGPRRRIRSWGKIRKLGLKIE